MDKAALLALAARVEGAAAEESKQRFWLIRAYEAIHGTKNINYAEWQRFEHLVNESAFLDAAAMLVPPRHGWMLDNFDGETGARRCSASVRVKDNWADCKGAATPALALTAAALRARAAMEAEVCGG